MRLALGRASRGVAQEAGGVPRREDEAAWRRARSPRKGIGRQGGLRCGQHGAPLACSCLTLLSIV